MTTRLFYLLSLFVCTMLISLSQGQEVSTSATEPAPASAAVPSSEASPASPTLGNATSEETAPAGKKKESKLTLKGGGAKPRDEIKGLYVAVQGGASLDQDSTASLDLQGSGIPGTGVNALSPNSEIAGAFGFKLGYVPYRDLEEKPLTATFGAEIEFNYIGLEMDGTDASGATYKTSLDTYQVMANLLLRAENKYVVPYVGAGFGLALFSPQDTSIIRTGTELANPTEDDLEGAFAYQFMGGLEYQVFKQWSVFMEYRYLVYDSFTLTTGAAGTANGKLKLNVDDMTQQIIQSGVKFRF